MSYGVTVIGLVSGHHVIEDIRVTVPYQVAVQISPEQSSRSKDLAQSIQDKRVLQVRGALPAGAVLRGTGAVPRPAAPFSPQRPSEADTTELQRLHAQVAQLTLELGQAVEREAQLKTREAQLQGLNVGLQTTLSTMAAQLQAIQSVLEDLKKQGIQVAHLSSGSPAFSSPDDNAPLFIPESFKDDSTKVNIQVKEETASDLTASRSALRNLRKGQKS